MLYSDRLVDLMDRKYRLVTEAPQEDFWLELERFFRFITDDEVFKPYTSRLLRELENWLSIYREKLVGEIKEASGIRKEFAERFPELDDSQTPRPLLAGDIVEIVYTDPYFKSFAWFDETVQRSTENRVSVWPRNANLNDKDYTEVGRLLTLLNDKVGQLPREQIPEDIFLKLHALQEKHHHMHRLFLAECRTWPPASLDFIRDVASRINPVPKQFGTIKEFLSETVDQSINQIIQPQVDPQVCLFHLRRVYEQLRADIGSVLSHYELVHRFKIRCMFYDRERIEEVIKSAGRQKEDALTRALALYLFDNGISVLYRVKRGAHEYDLIASSLFVEAKEYSASDKARLIRGISQLHAYINGLEADDVANIREVYYVVFRLGGPLYDWPEKIEMSRWTIYPVTIDLGPSRESGSRQPKVVKITLEEIYGTINEQP
jgi:hypothetical protein